MAVTAFTPFKTELTINGAKFPQLCSAVIDHASRTLRGTAIADGGEMQRALRDLRAGAEVGVSLLTGEGLEYEGTATVKMIRVRMSVRHAIRLAFAFTLAA